MTVHFLHVSRTGGSAMKAALEPFAEQYDLQLHLPHVRLQDIPRGEKVSFVVREPVGRFSSAFGSRLRKGLPNCFDDWSVREAAAFARFGSPNALAEHLSSPNLIERIHASDAMGSIDHVRTTMGDWFDGISELTQRKADILFVGFQDTLATDFELLKSMLGLPNWAALANGSERANCEPSTIDTLLSDLAVRNLRKWYAEDVEIYEYLRKQRRFSQAA